MFGGYNNCYSGFGSGFGGGYGGYGYASSMDTNPYLPGTQTSYLDSDPTRPGIQLPGSVNGIPHYSSAYDTNPYLSGTQLPGSYRSYY
jgi:hypothetical protein